MIKKILPCVAVCSLLASPIAFAQSSGNDWEAAVRTFDSAYWQAYNECNIAKMEQMNADDLEFYHDAGGAMIGKPKFAAAMRNNICGNPDRRVRREAVAGTIQVYPMHVNGKLYGAVVTGEHQFYNAAKGRPEQLSEHARFTHLLLLKDQAWKVSRVLSYDHAPVQPANKLVEIQLPEAALDRLAGNYIAPDKSVIVVKRAGNGLAADVGGRTFELSPTGPNEFFIKGSPLTVSFAQGEAGKGQGLTVRESGAIVAQATAAR
jgi:hypothetical protein